MTKRKAPKPPASPEMAHRADIQLMILEVATAALKAPTGTASYTRLAKLLIANPEMISQPEWRNVIVRILEAYVAGNQPPTLSPRETARLVDLELEGDPKLSLGEARRRVAEGTGKGLSTVIANHIEFEEQTWFPFMKRAPES